jgi:hypothetical protein
MHIPVLHAYTNLKLNITLRRVTWPWVQMDEFALLLIVDCLGPESPLKNDPMMVYVYPIETVCGHFENKIPLMTLHPSNKLTAEISLRLRSLV